MCVALAHLASRGGQCLAGLALVLAAFGADAATFLVGSGPGCNFSTIQAGINAAAANPGPDTVRIANATTWGPAGVTIGQQDVTLDGRFATCTDSVANGNYAQLVGNAVDPDSRPSMIRVTGSGVRRLVGLQIRNNVRGVNSNGGAIENSGSGELILSEMDLRDNRAQFGGAISSIGGTLTLADRVLIENNLADFSGGGIALGNNGTLYAVGSNLAIAGNEAYRNGGGLRVTASAQAYIASAGYAGRAVLQSNRAGISFDGGFTSGGAISVGVAFGAKVVVYSTDAEAPTRIADNQALRKGGAIHFDDSLAGESKTMCLLDVHLTGNRAEGGAALYAEIAAATNSSVVYNVPTANECQVPANAPAQPVRCNRDAAGCNVIEGHLTRLPNGTPSGGGVVTVAQNIRLQMRNARFVGNTAGHVLSTVDADRVELNTALIAGNVVSGPALRLEFAPGNQGLVMRNITIAGNTIGSGNPAVFLVNPATTIDFNNNLIFQPNQPALASTFVMGTDPNHNWRYNTTNPPQVLPNPMQALLTDVRFENAALGDYRLRIGSSAVNAFAAGAAIDAASDLDGRARPVNLSIFAPDPSNVDVGAYERQEADPWLVNGSFAAATQLRYWEPSANGEAIPGVVWDPQDAAGNPNSGSALVNLPLSLASRLTVLRRCFNVPAPGLYTITAKAQRGSGLNADNALLSWRFRVNDESCSSAGVQGAGEVAFATGDGFRPLAAPLSLDFPSVTTNSTIEIRLDAVSGLNLNGLTNVRFDDVAITGEPLRPEDVFANGFE